MAAFEGDVAAVAAYIDTGDVNVKDSDGRTLLHWVGYEKRAYLGFRDSPPSCAYRRVQEANVTLLLCCSVGLESK